MPASVYTPGASATLTQPRISIVIVTYNRWPLVAEAIQSSLDQHVPAAEIIVVDDGSEDGTAGYVANQFPQVRLIRQPNAERGAARNAGVAAASGTHVTFLDSDDRFEPSHIAELAAGLARGVEVVASSAQMWDSATGAVWPLRSSMPNRSTDVRAALWGNPLPVCCLGVRKDVFEALGGFPEDRAAAGSEDWVLALRLAARGPVQRVPHITASIRHHPGRSMADPVRIIASRIRATELILAEGVAGLPLTAAERNLLMAGTAYFRSANLYAADDTVAARAALRQAREHLPVAVWLRRCGRLWLQTLAPPHFRRGLRNARARLLGRT